MLANTHTLPHFSPPFPTRGNDTLLPFEFQFLLSNPHMARSRSLRKGKVFKPFKDIREYQSSLTPDDFPDPPHYSIMPEDVRRTMKQDMNKLTRFQVDELFRINKQYLNEYKNLKKKRKR